MEESNQLKVPQNNKLDKTKKFSVFGSITNSLTNSLTNLKSKLKSKKNINNFEDNLVSFLTNSPDIPGNTMEIPNIELNQDLSIPSPLSVNNMGIPSNSDGINNITSKIDQTNLKDPEKDFMDSLKNLVTSKTELNELGANNKTNDDINNNTIINEELELLVPPFDPIKENTLDFGKLENQNIVPDNIQDTQLSTIPNNINSIIEPGINTEIDMINELSNNTIDSINNNTHDLSNMEPNNSIEELDILTNNINPNITQSESQIDPNNSSNIEHALNSNIECPVPMSEAYNRTQVEYNEIKIDNVLITNNSEVEASNNTNSTPDLLSNQIEDVALPIPPQHNKSGKLPTILNNFESNNTIKTQNTTDVKTNSSEINSSMNCPTPISESNYINPENNGQDTNNIKTNLNLGLYHQENNSNNNTDIVEKTITLTPPNNLGVNKPKKELIELPEFEIKTIYDEETKESNNNNNNNSKILDSNTYNAAFEMSMKEFADKHPKILDRQSFSKYYHERLASDINHKSLMRKFTEKFDLNVDLDVKEDFLYRLRKCKKLVHANEIRRARNIYNDLREEFYNIRNSLDDNAQMDAFNELRLLYDEINLAILSRT